MHKYMTIKMSDGSKWAVPVDMIAYHRAKHYAHEYGGNIERSLAEDTVPLFESDDYEIEDWAVNNLNWSDFKGYQVRIDESQEPDFEDEWINGEKGFS